jgi:signal transduction histidine kinase
MTTSRWGQRLARVFAGVRARSTIAAVVTVAAALLAGALLLSLLLRHALTTTVEGDARAQAAQVVKQVQVDRLSALPDTLADENRRGQSVQVIDTTGRVVAASSVPASGEPLTKARPAPGKVVVRERQSLPSLGDHDPYLVVARGVTRDGADYTVVVAAPLKQREEAVETVLFYLFAGIPLLLLLVGGATWVLVGRSLRPVERIRARVHGITAARLDDRVPVPRSGDEVARLAGTMNEMLDRLDRAHGEQRRFLADASHELRSPLSTVIVGLEVAAADPTGQVWRETHPTMHAEAERMSELVHDLLLLAEADDTGLRLDRVDVDLDDLVDAEARRLRALGGVEVRAQIAPVRVRGDARKLSQLIRNLADNAAREADQRVRLALSLDDDAALLVIEDDGDGIPPQDRERVFDRFVRLDPSRERRQGGTGTGLGLAIVAEVVRAHGGAVRVLESPLGGARFEVRLPRVR